MFSSTFSARSLPVAHDEDTVLGEEVAVFLVQSRFIRDVVVSAEEVANVLVGQHVGGLRVVSVFAVFDVRHDGLTASALWNLSLNLWSVELSTWLKKSSKSVGPCGT